MINAPRILTCLAGTRKPDQYAANKLAQVVLGRKSRGWFKEGEAPLPLLERLYAVLLPKMAPGFYRSGDKKWFVDWVARDFPEYWPKRPPGTSGSALTWRFLGCMFARKHSAGS